MALFRIPDFRAHPLVRSGHAQTLAGVLFPGRLPPYTAVQHEVELDDGDRLVLHDDRPADWRPGDRAALLIHGLGGCHQSAYMRRGAKKLSDRGVRAFRMDLRGCGAGIEIARMPYHSGRSEDAAAALKFIERLCPGSPVTLVGFSLGGNIALKLLGECGNNPPGNLDSGMAVSPPVDLLECSRWLARAINRFYDRYFARLLYRRLCERKVRAPHSVTAQFPRRPRRLIEIDDHYTAPVCGFGTAENYYRTCSAALVVAGICLPTLVLASDNDPLIPHDTVAGAPYSQHVDVRVLSGGGHLGFIGSRGSTDDPDRRWLDWRLVDWVTSQGVR